MSKSAPPTAAIAKSSPMAQRIRWLRIRVGMAVTSGFLTAFLFAVLVRESQYLQRDGWLMDFYGDIRWNRVWLMGILIGAFLPNVRLSERWTRIFLGGLVGIPVAVYSIAAIDVFLAERAIARAFDSAPELSEETIKEWSLHRPSPGQKDYPSTFDRVYVQTMFSGLLCGFLTGCGLVATGRTRQILAVSTVLISIVLSTLIISKMNSEFESYVDRVQASLQNR